MSIVAALDRALKAAGLPIDGVSAGFRSRDGSVVKPATDRSTWEIQWAVKPTDAQLAAAQAVMDAIDPANPPRPPEPTVEQKLARIGLTVTDLKAALR